MESKPVRLHRHASLTSFVKVCPFALFAQPTFQRGELVPFDINKGVLKPVPSKGQPPQHFVALQARERFSDALIFRREVNKLLTEG